MNPHNDGTKSSKQYEEDLRVGRRFGVGLLLVMVYFIIEQSIAWFGLDPSDAIKAAEGIGYTQVQVVDRDAFFPGFQGCDGRDMVKFDMTAVDRNGQLVNIYACDSLFKGAVVRFK